MIRQYELRRMDANNVRRSLQGASSRSEYGAWVMVSMKNTKLPEYIDTLYAGDDECLFEGVTDGTVIDGRLYLLVFNKLTSSFDTELGVKLSAISESISVSYSPKSTAEA